MSQDAQVAVTIVIPTYNRAGFIAEAVSSCLSQANPSLFVEVIVIDDGSVDNTAAILESFGTSIKFLPQLKNRGRNRVRNIGLGLATGRYVKFLDSDDVLVPGSLMVEVKAAEATLADIVVSGWQTVEIRDGEPSPVTGRFPAPVMQPILDSLLAGRAVPTTAALYRRSSLGDLQWDEALRKIDDWDWFMRAALNSKAISSVAVTAYSWRSHPGQGTRSETLLRNAIEHHIILKKLELTLAQRGLLTPARRKRLAQYYYKEMRVLALYDKPAFDRAAEHLYELDPKFIPRDEERQWWMKLLCSTIGVHRTLLWHATCKRHLVR